jgi:simple sugar transport system ATP-binding protein
MIGAEPPRLTRKAPRLGEVALRVKALSLPRHHRFGVPLDRVSLELRAGEVVGIAGVSGNGQQELLAALSGEDARSEPGAVQLFGHAIGRMGAAARRRLGLHFVPEERLGRGAVPTLSLAQNLLLTRRESLGFLGWIDRRALHLQAVGIIDRFRVIAPGPAAVAKSLSGGNLQKYIVGREIDAVPRALIVAQPTWGVDVGAAAQIRAELLALRDAGCAVLVVSEELEELFEVTDRLYVMAKGRLSPPIATSAATVELIGEWMSGLWGEEPPEPAPTAAPPAQGPAASGESR